MIVKKVKNPKKTASKTARVFGLTDYILSPEMAKENEKCVYSGVRGFLCPDRPSQQSEMLALSQEAVRSKDTINHYVLSWREGERPTPEQIEEAVGIFLKKLGLEDHQTIYGLHADTDNYHLHIAINRVHPESLKPIKINKGFDIESAHEAIALIEKRQGWRREKNGRYHVLDDGSIGPKPDFSERPPQPDQTKRDMEYHTGEKSAERIAIEEGAPIIKQARTWQQLHEELSMKGMRYEKFGSGAKIYVGDIPVKASSAAREASLAQLQKRLGAYEEPIQSGKLVQRESEPVSPNLPGWNEYSVGRKRFFADKNKETLALKKKQEDERKALLEQQKEYRRQMLRGNWKGRGELRNGMQSVIAAEQASKKAELKDRQKRDGELLRKKFQAYPSLKEWQRDRGLSERAEEMNIVGDSYDLPTPRDIRSFVAEICENYVSYTRKDGTGIGFVDKGREIHVVDWTNKDTTLAALQLSAQKWGSFRITGSSEYKEMCVKLAAEHGFKLTNPELQEHLQQEIKRKSEIGEQKKLEPKLPTQKGPRR
ncbi:MAG: TraI/MobA(P) family conjugative relaxase [Alphaproteobacteria bacterium]